MSEKGTNLKALFDGMLETLEGSIKSPPWRVRYQSGRWPEQRSAELDGLQQQLSVQRSDGQTRVAEGYNERRKDMFNVVEERRRRLEAYAGRTRQVVASQADKFIIAGRVTDQASGVGLPNVKVSAFDMDRKQDDHLGNARTDALGYFRIEYTEADFRDWGEEQQPETYIEVLGEDNKVIHTSSKSFVQKASEVQFVKVEVDGKSVSKSLDAGQRIDESVKMRLDGFEARKRLLSTGESAFVPKRPVTPTTPAVKRSAAKKIQAKASAATAAAAKAATSNTKKQATTKAATARRKKQTATKKTSNTTAKPKTAAKAKASAEASKTTTKTEAAAANKTTASKTTAAKAPTSKKTSS